MFILDILVIIYFIILDVGVIGYVVINCEFVVIVFNLMVLLLIIYRCGSVFVDFNLKFL